LEAGLSFCVKLDKPDFIGRDALLHYRESNRKRKLVGLELIGKGIARHGFPVYLDGRPIGKVTTGTLIPGMERPVAVALIEAEAGATGNTVEIGIRKRMAEAVIVNKKFLKS
jgi:aminomethyltransferase